MIMPQDILQKLREAQRHLVEAARAIDGASINVRTLLERIEHDQQTPYSAKGDDDDR